VALDAATGAVRWRRPGGLTGVTTRGDVLLWDAVLDDALRPTAPGTLRSVIPASGEQRWEYRLTERVEPTYHAWPDIDFAAVRLTSGRVQLIDMATGQVFRSRDLPPPEPVTVGDSRYSINFYGDLMFVSSADLSTATAYGIDDLEPRWTVRLAPQEYGQDCGGYPCFLNPANSRLRVFDPQTGQVRWSDDRWVGVQAVRGRLLGVEAPENAPIGVLDPATGRVIGELHAWDLPYPGPSSDDDPLLGVHHDPSGRAWLAEIDLTKPAVHVLAVFDKVSGDCSVYAITVVCRRLDGSIGVWRRPE
jgi:outer membrane protein assembly factor BamB